MTSGNTRTCTVCQKEFKRKQRKKDAVRCCSRECGFILLNQERAAKVKRRARGKAVISAPVSLADVVKAHGKRCHLCGKAVDLSTINQPTSATMDHLVPLALGGWHDLSNLRPAHHMCNSMKGAQFTGQLMLTC